MEKVVNIDQVILQSVKSVCLCFLIQRMEQEWRGVTSVQQRGTPWKVSTSAQDESEHTCLSETVFVVFGFG